MSQLETTIKPDLNWLDWDYGEMIQNFTLKNFLFSILGHQIEIDLDLGNQTVNATTTAATVTVASHTPKTADYALDYAILFLIIIILLGLITTLFIVILYVFRVACVRKCLSCLCPGNSSNDSMSRVDLESNSDDTDNNQIPKNEFMYQNSQLNNAQIKRQDSNKTELDEMLSLRSSFTGPNSDQHLGNRRVTLSAAVNAGIPTAAAVSTSANNRRKIPCYILQEKFAYANRHQEMEQPQTSSGSETGNRPFMTAKSKRLSMSIKTKPVQTNQYSHMFDEIDRAFDNIYEELVIKRNTIQNF